MRIASRQEKSTPSKSSNNLFSNGEKDSSFLRGEDFVSGRNFIEKASGERGSLGNDKNSVPDYKTKLGAGGISGLVLDASFDVSNTPATTLQIIQVFWGTRRTDGLVVGKYSFKKGKKTYDGFVDGGVNSPFALAGSPAHPTEPYYLTPGELASQVTFTKDTGSIRVYDRPGAVAFHEEAFFETGIVAVNYKGKGKDKLLKVFKWGWKDLGKKPIHGKGIKLGGKSTGISLKGSFSSTSKKIIANDYPNFKFD